LLVVEVLSVSREIRGNQSTPFHGRRLGFSMDAFKDYLQARSRLTPAFPVFLIMISWIFHPNQPQKQARAATPRRWGRGCPLKKRALPGRLPFYQNERRDKSKNFFLL
jgi:hypothetical protein